MTVVLKVYPHLSLPEEFTQYGNWVQLTDHHIWQMILALIVIVILSKGRFKEWGLNISNLGESMRLLKIFFLYYGVYFIGIGFVIQLLFMSPPVLDHPIITGNIIGNLFFKFIISGLSEEILFRGMMQTYITTFTTKVWRWGNIEMPVAGFITAIIFTIVHINFTVFPFEITHLYFPQLILAFILGLFYAVAYHRTGSLLAPILAHNFSNGMLYISELLLVGLKQ